ncbi:short-chain dehydrogenase [Scopulibacillus cellulosilyticus]|uniref:Short-chain dehydrogenase n=1 Tax=Scopulibacillus cellulosilyticus TaxID=2665665 RepID=A0ABW2PUE7_9BACL
MGHDLIVGGTGMLKQVSVWLASQGRKVTIIGRNQEKFKKIQNSAANPENLYFLNVDYYDINPFTDHLIKTIKKHGPFDRAVVWMRSSAKESLQKLVDILSSTTEHQWSLFHVLGSSASRPLSNRQPECPVNVDYHQVILGFEIQNNGESRWLTHDEISNGVIHAMKNKDRTSIIGQVEPWSMRPEY